MDNLLSQCAIIKIRKKATWHGINILKIHPDGRIDTDEAVWITNTTISEIPFTFSSVYDDFRCYGNKLLTSIVGLPIHITGSLNINDNPILETLDGFPTFIGGDVYMENLPSLRCDVLNYESVKKCIIRGKLFMTPEFESYVRIMDRHVAIKNLLK